MSGNASLNTPGYLPTLYGSGGAGGHSLLASLYGMTSPGLDPVDPIAALRQARAEEARQIALISASPRVKNDLTQFTEALRSSTTPARFLAVPAVLKVLLTASGLEDQVNNTALATQALLSDPASPDALVNQLSDPRWIEVNRRFAFASHGLAPLNDPATILAIGQRYIRAVWYRELDQATPGLAYALDFVNRASMIGTVEQVMADPVFRTVLLASPGMPEQIAFQPRTAQEQAIATRIDLTSFEDPAIATQFAHRYLMSMAENTATGAETDGLLLDTAEGTRTGLIR